MSIGITLDNLLDLESLGVLQGIEPIGNFNMKYKSTSPEKFEIAFACNNKGLFVTSDDLNSDLTLPAYKVTKLGKEIISLGKFEANVPYVRKIGEEIKDKGFEVKLGDIVTYVDDEIEAQNMQQL
ncbi:hypothetical protein ACFLQ0_01860 [Nitrospinota bacterium]